MKTIYQTILILSLLLSFSCETDIPETDTTLPTFSLKIDGDGFDRTFIQDDNFESKQLNTYIGNHNTEVVNL